MGTNCATLADLFLFCYERDFMTSLSEPELYGDLVYKFKNIIGRNNFLISFEK